MKKYIGVKIVSAEPMDAESALLKGYKIGGIIKKDDPGRFNGYEVTYPDGYVSWCPKEQFEEANRETDGMTFGMALEVLKKGLLVSRKGWNGKGMFLFMRPADELHIEFVVHKVKTLPQSVRDYYRKDTQVNEGCEQPYDESDVVKFTAYICMKAADGSIVNGWLASQTDMLSEDWVIFE